LFVSGKLLHDVRNAKDVDVRGMLLTFLMSERMRQKEKPQRTQRKHRVPISNTLHASVKPPCPLWLHIPGNAEGDRHRLEKRGAK
jgi:hypothetical protein